jgi:uncharacterized protein (TIGR02453 family)
MKKQIPISNSFAGFGEETYKFYNELKANNNKEWFAENKPRYEQIKQISKNFVNEMKERFAAMNMPYFADEKKSLFRINRDIRFSNDKSPYKTNLGVYFLYTPNLTQFTDLQMGLYFHIEESGCFFAGGVHMPDPQTLFGVRNHIADNWDEYLEIVEEKDFKKNFPDMFSGEKLKKAPKGFDPTHPGIEVLKQKDFTALCNIPKKVALGSDLCDITLEKGITLLPFIEFLFGGKASK